MQRLIRLTALAFALVMVFAIEAGVRAAETGVPPGIADGPGIWINLWNYPKDNLDAYVRNLDRHGIRNVFIQTSRSNTEAITDPVFLGRFIEACHRHDIRLIAWSFGELKDPVGDADKMIAAARFKSPEGQQLDGIAPNLEKNLSITSVDGYLKHLRAGLGWHYPVIGVVFSPLNRAPQVARTPWKVLDKYCHVIAPMTYWGGKHQELDAYSYTKQTICRVRQLVGRSDLELHMIGDGMGTTSQDFKEFLKACKDYEVASASLYPNHKVAGDQLTCLSQYGNYFAPNSRFKLAAFRELKKAGAINDPPSGNPAESVRRGDFYRLAVMQLCPVTDPENPVCTGRVNDLQAFNLLNARGIVPVPAGNLGQHLSGRISAQEAYQLIAGLLADQSESSDMPRLTISDHARAKDRPINYLQASQMVLQARAGLM